MTAAWWQAMHLIGAELCNRTASDHTVLCRFARHAPITGNPITGFARAT
jgi:hypothetical protein